MAQQLLHTMTELEENQKLVGAYTGCIFGLFPLMLCLWTALIGGGIADFLYRWLMVPTEWLSNIMILAIPVAIFKRFRGSIGCFLMVTSFWMGMMVVLVSVCGIAVHWNRFGLFVSCLLAPTVPVLAVIADALNGDHWGLYVILWWGFIAIVSRFFGIWLYFTSLSTGQMEGH
jgi:hypothetical protein